MRFYFNFETNRYQETFSRDEYEDTPELLLILEEFKFLYEGIIFLDFGASRIVAIDFDFEFVVEYYKFLGIPEFLCDDHMQEYNIWVSEQGADYYLKHKKNGDQILIEFVKGAKSGNKLDDFEIVLSNEEYEKEWRNLFSELFAFILEKLPEYRDLPIFAKYR